MKRFAFAFTQSERARVGVRLRISCLESIEELGILDMFIKFSTDPRSRITPINVRVVLTSPNFGAELLPRPWSPGRAEGILVTAVDSALL